MKKYFYGVICCCVVGMYYGTACAGLKITTPSDSLVGQDCFTNSSLYKLVRCNCHATAGGVVGASGNAGSVYCDTLTSAAGQPCRYMSNTATDGYLCANTSITGPDGNKNCTSAVCVCGATSLSGTDYTEDDLGQGVVKVISKTLTYSQYRCTESDYSEKYGCAQGYYRLSGTETSSSIKCRACEKRTNMQGQSVGTSNSNPLLNTSVSACYLPKSDGTNATTFYDNSGKYEYTNDCHAS